MTDPRQSSRNSATSARTKTYTHPDPLPYRKMLAVNEGQDPARPRTSLARAYAEGWLIGTAILVALAAVVLLLVFVHPVLGATPDHHASPTPCPSSSSIPSSAPSPTPSASPSTTPSPSPTPAPRRSSPPATSRPRPTIPDTATASHGTPQVLRDDEWMWVLIVLGVLASFVGTCGRFLQGRRR